MRDRVNVSIDHRLKKMFEAIMDSHGIEWNEMFEEAVIDFLIKKDPVQTLEFLIKQEEEKLQERKIDLIKAKANIHVLDHQKIDHELAKRREEWFEKESNWLPKAIIRGDTINWDRILFRFEFENKKEALAWLRPRVEQLKKLEKIK
jgi:hypothetical protein